MFLRGMSLPLVQSRESNHQGETISFFILCNFFAVLGLFRRGLGCFWISKTHPCGVRPPKSSVSLYGAFSSLDFWVSKLRHRIWINEYMQFSPKMTQGTEGPLASFEFFGKFSSLHTPSFHAEIELGDKMRIISCGSIRISAQTRMIEIFFLIFPSSLPFAQASQLPFPSTTDSTLATV